MAELNEHQTNRDCYNGFDNDTNGQGLDFESGVDTESNCSLEDAAARVEIALRKNLKLDECHNGVCRIYEELGTYMVWALDFFIGSLFDGVVIWVDFGFRHCPI